MRPATLLAALAGFLLAPAAAPACGGDERCLLGDRYYLIAMPPVSEARHPGAILFAHGYRGSAEGTMGDAGLRSLAADLGVALLAVKSAGDDWVLPGSPQHPDSDGRIESDYVAAVLDDAAARFGIDRGRVLMSGFSAGGMLAWTLACTRPDLFAGFAPMSGTYWVGPPRSCDGPPRSLVHFHGDADPVVPQQGRAIGPTRQGDVAAALAAYAAAGGFVADEVLISAGLGCEFSRNPAGRLLGFCQFPGGHEFRVENLLLAWTWIMPPPP